MALFSGFTQLSDIHSGIDAITAILQNESHSFSASSAGVVTIGDTAAQVAGGTGVQVFVGASDGVYKQIASTGTLVAVTTTTTGSATNLNLNLNEFGIRVGALDNATAVVDGNNARTRTTAFNGDTSDTGSVTVQIFVNRNGSIEQVDRVQSLTASRAGSTGVVKGLQITTTRHNFTFDSAGVAVTGGSADIVMNANRIGVTGDVTWTQGVNGATPTSTQTIGTVSGTNDVTLTVTAANFGTNQTVSYRARAGTTPNFFDDIITLFRVTDGADGDDTFTVVMTIESGNPAMTDNSGSVQYKANLFKGATIVTPVTAGGNTWTYKWEGNGTTFTESNVDVQSGASTTNSARTSATTGNYSNALLDIQADGTILGGNNAGAALLEVEIDTKSSVL